MDARTAFGVNMHHLKIETEQIQLIDASNSRCSCESQLMTLSQIYRLFDTYMQEIFEKLFYQLILRLRSHPIPLFLPHF